MINRIESTATQAILQSAYWYDDQERLEFAQDVFAYALSSDTRHDSVFYSYTYDDSDGMTEDSVGALEEFEVSGGGNQNLSISYTYDVLYRADVKTLVSSGGFSYVVDYGYRDHNSYFTTGQIGSYSSQIGTNTTTYTYEYDEVGNIKTITEGTNVTRYDYDDMGQLIREDNPYLGKTYTYTYDNAGNRLSKTTYAYTTEDTLGTATNTQFYAYNDNSTWGDRLSGYTYDAIGNPSYYNGYALTWNGRQLMKMSMNGGQMTYSFTYNADGIRTSKIINNLAHNYTLNGSQIISESWGNHLIIYLYDESGAPIGLQYRTTNYDPGKFDTYYFEKNIFGDVVGVYTEAGVKIGTYTYDAWGNCTVSEVSTATSLQRSIVRTRNPFRYRGYYYDTDTGLYYLQSRYYNPATGRFINADGYVNANGDLIGFNMYAYCSNNPVMLTDPFGERFRVNISQMHGVRGRQSFEEFQNGICRPKYMPKINQYKFDKILIPA